MEYLGKTINGIKYLAKTDKRTQSQSIIYSCQCYCGNIFDANPYHIYNGQLKSCGCLRNKDLSGSIFNNIRLIEKLPIVGKYIDYKCRCHCGNDFIAHLDNVRKGNTKSCGCNSCPNLSGRISPTGILLIKKLNKINSQGENLYLCQCFCDKIFEASGTIVKNGRKLSCGCSRVKDLVGKRFHKLLVKQKLDKRGRQYYWKCLCDCGNEVELSLASLTHPQRRACGKCRRNSNISDEYRYSRRFSPENRLWKIQIFERDNYTCQICDKQSGGLNAHHLNGYHWCKEQRFELDNGLTLCISCHKSFHKEYGYKNNTRQQFIEFAEGKWPLQN